MGLFKFFRRKKEVAPIVVERELWYDLVSHLRAWDVNWQNFLEGTDKTKPMTKDEFIDRMIKKFKLSERPKKHN